MVELEHSVIPGLANQLINWRSYVGDTTCYMKVDSIDYILSKLNNLHKNIQFTVEIEKEGRISFIDVLMIRDKSNIETTVHRKSAIITSTSVGHHMHQINGKWAPFEH